LGIGKCMDSAVSWVRFYINRIKGSHYLYMILLAVVIGLGGGFGAVGFRYLIRLVQRLAFSTWNYNLAAVEAIPWYLLIFIPAVGGLLIYPLVNRFAREAKGHGVPEVMEAISLRSGQIRPRIVFVKALASAICIGTGGSVGREGPIVQIGSAFGSTVGQILRLSATQVRTLVGCGAAAGIAATFNAPIAGSLFAVEVILGDFGVPQFTPIVIASVVSTIVSRRFLGNMPAFIVPNYELVSAYEMIPYALLGLMAAFVGVGFSTLLYKAEDLFEEAIIPGITKPVIGGLILGVVAVFFPHILGVGYETITMALAGKMAWYLLLALIFLKLAATSITLGSGGSGGIFAPSLFLGAMTGGFLGMVVPYFMPFGSGGSGAYAMVGMGAVVAATTHAPLSAMIIIFEMTGDYKIIPPLMAACVISTIIAIRLKPTSIYTEKLARRGVNIREPLELNVLRKLPVSYAITPKPVVLSEETRFQDLVNLVVNSARSEFFVVRNENQYVGTISVQHMRKVLLEGDWLNPLIIARDLADSTFPIVRPEDNLDLVLKLFSQRSADELPVVTGDKLVGSVRKSDVLAVYHQELMERDLSGSFYGSLTCATRTKCVDLGEGYIMAEVETPPHFVGKTLSDLEVRANYGVEVILVRRAKKSGQRGTIVGVSDYRFAHGDVVLIAGLEERVRRFLE
jgi:CIC family chloride channel protein